MRVDRGHLFYALCGAGLIAIALIGGGVDTTGAESPSLLQSVLLIAGAFLLARFARRMLTDKRKDER